MAGALLASVPVAIAYNFFLDRLISGITGGAVKLSNRLRPPPLITAPAIVQPSGACRVLICDASDSKPNTEHSRSIWPSRRPLAFAPSSSDREGPA
jgi:hypothetical protein